MCPMRFLLVFFSALLAAYIAWKTVSPSSEDEKMGFDDDDSKAENASSEGKQEYSKMKMIQNGFWGFVDMASGRYLWRNLKDIKNINVSTKSQ